MIKPYITKTIRRVVSIFYLFYLFVFYRHIHNVIKHVIQEKKTYLDISALFDIFKQIHRIEKEKIDGILIEAGVALGGSSLVMTVSKNQNRPIYLYDSFEMIPSPSNLDGPDAHNRYNDISSGMAKGINGDEYYGYQNNLIESVTSSFVDSGFSLDIHNVKFINGYYEDTLVVKEPVALAHIDCDWYDSVMVCLAQIEPHLVTGGVLIIDDYNDWSGCRMAVDSYFSTRKERYDFVMKSRLHIIRK